MTGTPTVYINRLAAFYPNAPVANGEMEAVLGRIGGQPSRARRLVLRYSGIKSRYYVLDPATGEPRYNNAQLTAEAVRNLDGAGFSIEDIQLLSCGTSTPDQIMPNHAVMVHGEIGTPPCETAASAGICISGVSALKYAWMSVLAGLSDTAVATGSEVASTFMQAKHFEAESEDRVAALERRPELSFDRDFLRWMLSDGAGALLLQSRPNTRGLSLEIEWIAQFSYANEMPVCMMAGGEQAVDGGVTGWREYPSVGAAATAGAFAIQQDVRLLNESVVRMTLERGLTDALNRHPLRADQIDWFLPHYSSEYFRDKTYAGLKNIGFEIPYEKWFTNLSRIGNVGSASIYLMLEELTRSGRLQHGERLLCVIPESGRFSAAFVLLRANVPWS